MVGYAVFGDKVVMSAGNCNLFGECLSAGPDVVYIALMRSNKIGFGELGKSEGKGGLPLNWESSISTKRLR